MAFSKHHSIIVALLYLFPNIVQSKNHNAIIENLLSFGETELAIFIDDSVNVKDVVDQNHMERPLKIFNQDKHIEQKKPKRCQIFPDPDVYVFYKPFYLNSAPKHYTVVVHVKNMFRTLAIFDKSVLECLVNVEPGIYHRDNRFLFIVKANEKVSKSSEDIFDGSPFISNHRHVAIAKQFLLDEKRYLIFGLNLGLGKKSKSKLLYVWDARAPPKTLEVGFYGGVTTNYQGHKFRMRADFMNANDVRLNCLHKIKEKVKLVEVDHLECSGFEVMYAEYLRDMFNMTWGVIFNAKVMFPSGAFYRLINSTGRKPDKADYLISIVHLTKNFFLDYNINHHHIFYSSILNQAPKKKSTVYSMVYPFSIKLWPVVIGSVIIMSIVFPATSYLKRATGNAGYHVREQGVSAWFSFSALIGENMRNESVELHSAPIRLLIGVWILACFILSAGFAGNLRGFLMNPGEIKNVIDSHEKLLESKLPCYREPTAIEVYAKKRHSDNEIPLKQNTTHWRRFRKSEPFHYGSNVRNLTVNTVSNQVIQYTISILNDVNKFQMYKVYKGEAIMTAKSQAYQVFYDGLFVSKTGYKGIHLTNFNKFSVKSTVTYLPKISLLTANFDKMKMIASAKGLDRQWIKWARNEMADSVKKMFENHPNMTIDLEPEPILKTFTLTDLQGAFYILFIMLGISIVVFFCEIFISKRGKRRVNRVAKLINPKVL